MLSFVSDADVDEVVEVESAIAYCCRLSSAAKHNHCVVEEECNREQRRDFVARKSKVDFCGSEREWRKQKRKERGVGCRKGWCMVLPGKRVG